MVVGFFTAIVLFGKSRNKRYPINGNGHWSEKEGLLGGKHD
jgi:hypothetical protein